MGINLIVSSFLLLFLLVLGLPQAVGLLDPGDGLSLALLHELPALPPLPVSLEDGLFPLPFLLDFSEVPLEVVEFVGHPLEFLLGLALGVGEGEHVLVVGVDQVDQLVVVCLLLVFLLGLVFAVLGPLLLQLALLRVNLRLQLFLPVLVVLGQSLV